MAMDATGTCRLVTILFYEKEVEDLSPAPRERHAPGAAFGHNGPR
jgi:hypothetical protein